MLFSSHRFFLFLAAVLVLLSLRIRNERKLHFLAAASCFFYAAWDVRYLALLLAVSAIDYYCAARIAAAPRDSRHRGLYLAASIISNLGILAYFKYADFFIDNANHLGRHAGFHIDALHVLLPAGISFYTFKTMSYTIDVYRGEIQPVRSLIDYTTFVTFFPELIAGPIVRASVFLPQMSRDIGPTRARLASGASLFLLGLTKKVLVADRVASIADPIFASPTLYSTASIWCGVVAYAIQIYCDFSGYSDMAVGTAKMIGYDLPENFDMPYLSGSVTEFWRRWHITLSTWLRDYLYIPLGGNRGSPWRTYFNLLATMVLGGLWHGASWNFVLWGTLHGGALAGHRWLRGRLGSRFVVPRVLAVPATLLFVMLCWVPFRATTTAASLEILQRLFIPTPGVSWIPYPLLICAALVVAAHVIGDAIARSLRSGTSETALLRAIEWCGAQVERDPISGWYLRFGLAHARGVFVVSAWVVTIYFFGAVESAPFIYFQF